MCSALDYQLDGCGFHFRLCITATARHTLLEIFNPACTRGHYNEELEMDLSMFRHRGAEYVVNPKIGG